MIQMQENQLLYGFHKVTDKNATYLHVGDSPTNVINETLTVNYNKSRFIKSRLSILGTNIDVESGYRDCVYINGNYIGRICESNEVVSNGLHSCTYPLKKEMVNNGDNIISITGGTVNGCM